MGVSITKVKYFDKNSKATSNDVIENNKGDWSQVLAAIMALSWLQGPRADTD